MGFLDRFTKRKEENNFEYGANEPRNSTEEELDNDMDFPPEVLVKPGGLRFEFLVKPNLSKEDQQKLKRGILYSSGLIQYYRPSIEFEENFKVGKTRVTVTCLEPHVPVERSEETDFYQDVKELFSTWTIEALKSIGHHCELYNWSYDKNK
ncbi:MAG: hypothetical protein R6U44_11370 [Archaeoglobaceae archaeon]